MKKTNKKGFTLVELVVVVAVLLILAAIAVPTVMNLVNDAKNSAAEANALTIETSIKYAHAQNEIKGAGTVATVQDALNLSGIDSTLIGTGGKFFWDKTTKTVKVGAYTAANTNEVDLKTGTAPTIASLFTP